MLLSSEPLLLCFENKSRGQCSVRLTPLLQTSQGFEVGSTKSLIENFRSFQKCRPGARPDQITLFPRLGLVYEIVVPWLFLEPHVAFNGTCYSPIVVGSLTAGRRADMAPKLLRLSQPSRWGNLSWFPTSGALHPDELRSDMHTYHWVPQGRMPGTSVTTQYN